MCCCIPLRRLSYLGSFVHIGIGLYYLYLLGIVAYHLFELSSKDYSKERTVMGMLYIGYYATFLPPGVFIFLGVHKKMRHFLVLPPIIFLIVICYGIGLESFYGYRPSRLPQAMQLALKESENKLELSRLRAGFWMDIFTQIATALVYLFMLFFYYREIGPESTPVPSRYRQAYQAASQAACGQQGMMVGSPGTHSVVTGGPRFGGGPGSIVGNPHDGPSGQGGSMGQRTFRPLNVMGNESNSSSHLVQNTFIPPFNMPNQSGGGGGGGDSGGGGGSGSVPRSNAHFIRSANPGGILDLASFSNLTLEQQRELAILQAHPLLSQQHTQQQIHPQHLQQLLSSQDPRLLEFLQAQAQAAAAQSKKNLY